MIDFYKQRLDEIGLCIRNEDLNGAGRQMMDYASDLHLDQLYQYKAMRLRKRYNEEKELGRSRVNNQMLQSEFEELFNELKRIEIQVENITGAPATICSVKEISKIFRSRLHNFQFEPISLDFKTGEIIGLVGENGNGKTTLLRMLAGDLSIDEGRIDYFGKSEQDWRSIKDRIAFVPQRIERWFGTAEDNVSFMASIKGFHGEENEEKTEFIIHRLGLTNFRELTWAQLSSGYRLRFEIARALVWNPEILILDEPLANLDIQAQELLLQDLRQLANSRRHPVGIILSSQQLHEVEVVADHIIFLKNGRAVYNGRMDSFRMEDQTNTYELFGNLTYQDLINIFEGWEGVKVEKSASAFVMSIHEKYSNKDVWKRISESGFEMTYFRDISNSTKKFFGDKY